ncbi:MAG: nucleoside-triphosphatase [Saprospiraceae bacterium]
MSILLIHGPVRTGKTTKIQSILENHPEVGGILTPDVDNLRMIYSISDQSYFPFETDNETDVDVIGRFRFLKSAFVKGSNIVIRDFEHKKYILLDEWGPLEISGKGFYPYLNSLMKRAALLEKKWLLVVLRSAILNQFIEQFGLPQGIINSNDFEGIHSIPGAY